LGWNNFYLLGYLVEEVTGNSLDVEFDNRIFNPLGLNTAYTGSSGVDMSTINGSWLGSYDRGNLCWDAYLSSRGGASGLICSSLDAAKFMRYFYQDSLVNSTLMQEVKEPTLGSTQIAPNPFCGGSIVGSYGYGSFIFEFVDASGDTTKAYGHNASGLHRALSVHNADSNFTVSFIQNDIADNLNNATTAFFLEISCYISENLQHPVSTSIDEKLAKSKTMLYPNPVINELTLQGNWNANAEFQILDINGKCVDASYKRSDGLIAVDVSGLTQGVYFVEVISANVVDVKKFIKH
jgi:hypothetical protein